MPPAYGGAAERARVGMALKKALDGAGGRGMALNGFGRRWMVLNRFGMALEWRWMAFGMARSVWGCIGLGMALEWRWMALGMARSVWGRLGLGMALGLRESAGTAGMALG